MTQQQKFYQYLRTAQSLSATPEKMPYLCVIGTHDFDELRAELNSQEQQRVLERRVIARVHNEWDPFKPGCETYQEFKERVSQEEFLAIGGDGSTPASSPLVAEAEAFLDSRQKVSSTEYLEFCGCRCFRSLCDARGYWFA